VGLSCTLTLYKYLKGRGLWWVLGARGSEVEMTRTSSTNP